MSNLSAQNTLMDQRTKYAKQGLMLALLSAIGQGFGSSMSGVVSGMQPFANPSFTVWTIVVVSFITSGLHDFFAGGWIMFWNKLSHRTLTEYIRLMRTKVGLLLVGAALLGGPVASAGWMVAIYLCGPTYALAISGIFPIIGTLSSSILLKEKVPARAWFGIIVAVIGVFIISYSPPSGDAYPYFFIGIFFAFLCALGWGLEGTVVSYAGDMIDPNIGAGIFRTFGSGLFFLLVMVPVTGLIGGIGGFTGWHILGEAIVAVKPVVFMAIAALGGGCSIYLFYQCMNTCGVSRTMCINITNSIWSIPICFILQAIGLMTYDITPRAIVGVVVVVLGTLLCISNPKDMVDLRKN